MFLLDWVISCSFGLVGVDKAEEDDDITLLVASLVFFDASLLPALLSLSPPNGVGAFNEIGGYADEDDADAGANDVFVLSDSCLVFVDEGVAAASELVVGRVLVEIFTPPNLNPPPEAVVAVVALIVTTLMIPAQPSTSLLQWAGRHLADAQDTGRE